MDEYPPEVEHQPSQCDSNSYLKFANEDEEQDVFFDRYIPKRRVSSQAFHEITAEILMQRKSDIPHQKPVTFSLLEKVHDLFLNGIKKFWRIFFFTIH